MLPAHLMGNMWQQDWGNLWDILAPYENAGSLDITGALEAELTSAGIAQISGMAIADAVTPYNTSIALALIGIELADGSGVFQLPVVRGNETSAIVPAPHITSTSGSSRGSPAGLVPAGMLAGSDRSGAYSRLCVGSATIWGSTPAS